MGDGVRTDIVTQLLALSSEKKDKLADVFKSFNLYVNSRNVEIAGDIINILDNFRPKSYLGQLLRWKLINRYQVSPEVSKLLRSGNTADISRALKCDWFFHDLTDHEIFLNDLPSYSLSTRLKVINKYGLCLKVTKVGDKMYTGVKARYGSKTAFALLPACSENFIRTELHNMKGKLHPRLIQALFEKHPTLLTEQLNTFVKSDKPSDQSRISQFQPVVEQLAVKDLATFIEIYDKSSKHFFIKLGRRPTKKIIKFEMDRILNDYEKYLKLFKDKNFFSRLSLEQFKQLYMVAYMPAKISSFYDSSKWKDCFAKLSMIKPSVRSQMIQTTFNEKYGLPMTSDKVLYSLRSLWLSYLPDEAKISWVENKLSLKEDSIETQAEYIANLPTKVSIPKLKKLIESLSDANNRLEVARYFLITMQLNKDSSQMSDIFEYLVRRFRNEVPQFRVAIIREMSVLSKELYEALDLSEWAPINDFVNIIKINNEASRYKYALRCVFSQQVHAFHKKNGDVDACIRNYLEYELSDGSDLDSDVARLCCDTPSQKYCLEWFIKELPQMQWKSDKKKDDFIVQVFDQVSRFNEKKTEGRIALPDWFINILKFLLDDANCPSYHRNDIIGGMIRDPDPRMKDCIVRHRRLSCSLACSWLKNEPSSVLQKVRIIMEKALHDGFKSYYQFFKKCRLYQSYGIPSEIVKICKITLKLEEAEYDLPEDSIFLSTSAQPEALQTLAVLVEPSEYLSIIKPYVPTEHKIESYSEEFKALYEVQKVVCLPFLEFPNPKECLPILRQFAKGDYLKSVVGVLLGLCSQVPEKEILGLFKEWIDCPVSLRKHFLRLTYIIAPVQDSVTIFSNVFKTEKNTSLRLVLFQMIRKVFIEEPVEENFQLFKTVVNGLTIEDEEALQKIFEVNDIDDAFMSRYVELLWRLVATEWTKVLPKGRDQICNIASSRVLSLLDEGLNDELLSHKMTTSLPNVAPADFLNAYLVECHTGSVQIARLHKVLNWLKPLIAEKWCQLTYTDQNLPVSPVRSVVSQIVLEITDYCHQKPVHTVSPLSLLLELKTSLQLLIKPQHFLQESIAVDLTVELLKKQQLALDEAAYNSNLVNLFNAYVTEYGNSYGYILVKYLSQGPGEHNLALKLVENSSHPLILLIAIEILEKSSITEDAQLPAYKKAIEILTKSDDLCIQASLHQFLKTLRCSASSSP